MRSPAVAVLSNWQEIGSAHLYLTKEIPFIPTWPNKQWDLWCMMSDLQRLDRSCPTLDIGCSGNAVLRLCWNMGFTNIIGVDLHLTLKDRFRYFEDVVKHNILDKKELLPYRMYQKDYLHIGQRNKYTAITALSVVEHGVDADQFFSKAAELLQPGGILCITTDYWMDPIDTTNVDTRCTFGLEWEIFDPAKLQYWIDRAGQYGFLTPKLDEVWKLKPDVTCHWNGISYTAIYISFVKSGSEK